MISEIVLEAVSAATGTLKTAAFLPRYSRAFGARHTPNSVKNNVRFYSGDVSPRAINARRHPCVCKVFLKPEPLLIVLKSSVNPLN